MVMENTVNYSINHIVQKRQNTLEKYFLKNRFFLLVQGEKVLKAFKSNTFPIKNLDKFHITSSMALNTPKPTKTRNKTFTHKIFPLN